MPTTPLLDTAEFIAPTAVGTLFGRSYARSRLWLGITGVGLTTLGALTLLVSPGTVSSLVIAATGTVGARATDATLPALAAVTLALVLAQALVLLPLDLLGGTHVVREAVPFARWLLRWARGVAGLALLVVLGALALATGARLGGAGGTVLAALVAQLAWLALQGPLAQLVSGVAVREASPELRIAAARAELPLERVREVDADDLAFVGGWIGLPPVLWVPARWMREMPLDALVGQLVRRRLVVEGGLRTRGLLGALAWNTIGVALLTFGVRIIPALPSDLVLLLAGMTLWSFLGVLLFPTPSRRAIFATDRDAARTVGAHVVISALRFIDARQDDEVERVRGVETVFHPVPSRGSREAALVRPDPPAAPRGAWHLTRLMLGTATMCGGLLGRAVHCNVGRPALWIVYPGD